MGDGNHNDVPLTTGEYRVPLTYPNRRYYIEGLPNFVYRPPEESGGGSGGTHPPLNPYDLQYALNRAQEGTPENDPANYVPIGHGLDQTPSDAKVGLSPTESFRGATTPLRLVVHQGEVNARGWIRPQDRHPKKMLYVRVYPVPNRGEDGNRLSFVAPNGEPYSSTNEFVYLVESRAIDHPSYIYDTFAKGVDKLVYAASVHAIKCFKAWQTEDLAMIAKLQRLIGTLDIPELQETWGYWYYQGTFIRSDTRTGGPVPRDVRYQTSSDDPASCAFPVQLDLVHRPRMFVDQGQMHGRHPLTGLVLPRMIKLVPPCLQRVRMMAEVVQETMEYAERLLTERDALDSGMSEAEKDDYLRDERGDFFSDMMTKYNKSSRVDPLAILFNSDAFAPYGLTDGEGKTIPRPVSKAKAKRMLAVVPADLADPEEPWAKKARYADLDKLKDLGDEGGHEAAGVGLGLGLGGMGEGDGSEGSEFGVD